MSEIDYQAILPEGWQRARGFSYGVVATGSRILRIAGQIGGAEGGQPVDPGLDFGGQWERAMGNLVAIVRAAGGEPEHIVMLRAYVTDTEAFNAAGAAVGAAWGEHLGRHFPAMTLVEVSRLLDPNAMVEIEGEAVLP
ncbi:MAG: RidA family protein [Rhodospirillaceae bacterium]|jgi:enamine deaminase RidA (YjgF/YER057c/UK114 family)|nr:RidA family protein [Rhodospirillaceae bacterium]MBT5194864.1 RidA family protein [Rhodospirillaceae bacterium]MBT5899133.1 RidA family protein [Rhodospirillaceae bacterium]MBT6427955.1 RidA family protein [Rhodospirillaceae bacterium]MBT7757380.1 RidA family protein [Rhodospirillaceae bacterium]